MNAVGSLTVQNAVYTVFRCCEISVSGVVPCMRLSKSVYEWFEANVRRTYRYAVEG